MDLKEDSMPHAKLKMNLAKSGPLQDWMAKLSWDEVRTLPLQLFHVAGGAPIMGHVAKPKHDIIRLWAPAVVNMSGPTTVTFTPIAFVERYIDLFATALRGTNPIPDALVAGYAGYFDQFAQGNYRICVLGAGIDSEAPIHSADLAGDRESPQPADAEAEAGVVIDE
jgi:hypothetical protein